MPVARLPQPTSSHPSASQSATQHACPPPPTPRGCEPQHAQLTLAAPHVHGGVALAAAGRLMQVPLLLHACGLLPCLHPDATVHHTP
jgi:hypothetical protein